MPRFFRTPALLPWLFPGVLWQKPAQEKILYLTFDDGPIPQVTEFVLEQLRQYGAKATFFCVGDNLRRHPHIARAALAQEHVLGNHTFHHVKAWRLSPKDYLREAAECQAALAEVAGEVGQKKLFRPPHGQLTGRHLRMLTPEYQVVMWSSLSYDFDARLSPEECLRKTVAASGPGSIVVLHDSLKAERNLRYVLPRLLAHFAALGYSFQTL